MRLGYRTCFHMLYDEKKNNNNNMHNIKLKTQETILLSKTIGLHEFLNLYRNNNNNNNDSNNNNNALRTISKGLVRGLKELEVKGWTETNQTTTLLRSARILRRVLETWRVCLCLVWILPEKYDGARVSWCMCNKPSRSAVFFLFGFKRWRGEDRKEGGVVTLGCKCRWTENTFFFLLHWFSHE